MPFSTVFDPRRRTCPECRAYRRALRRSNPALYRKLRRDYFRYLRHIRQTPPAGG